ncbi:hypothetical protein ACLB90_10500 [Stenotrophomonas sp. LGBM10]|uniref:hypothetical protein n=1 Tax=Stenotrophomonas sp. LGBM10 TaxID=3390038 RepID=UPI00398A5322
MALALIALLLIEVVLQFAWVPRYFGCGIVAFTARVPAPAALRPRLALNCLERDVVNGAWQPLVFHPLPDGRIAFRESFFVSFARRYYPVMRGLVAVDTRRNEVRIVGLYNWNALFITLAIPLASAMIPRAAPMLLVLSVFVASYLIQRRRFAAVADAVRAQLADVESVEVLMARRMPARSTP